MADIVYVLDENVYLNITNRCPCACTFCIRGNADHVSEADRTLWHRREPELTEILAEIRAFDFTGYDEIVFCGYGEPLYAFDKLIETAKFIRKHYDLKIRVNTNGLGDLINGKPTAKVLGEHIDAVSISLNGPNNEIYQQVTKPKFGDAAYPAMIQYIKDCKQYVKEVSVSLVDVIDEKAIAECRNIAEELGVELRVRHWIH